MEMLEQKPILSGAVPLAMIQQLAASGGTGVVLMVSVSKPSATDEIFTPGAATGPLAGTAPDATAQPTEPTLQITLAAPPVSVSIAVNGEILKIRDLTEPILLTVLSKKKLASNVASTTRLHWNGARRGCGSTTQAMGHSYARAHI